MISKQQQKFIKSLQIKKYRKQAQNFLVEGEKNVHELIHSDFKINTLFITSRFQDNYNHLIEIKHTDVQVVTQKELESVGSLITNDAALAIATIPEEVPFGTDLKKWIPVYENLQDPGNLGTILRISDWFGLDKIVLSVDSVDVYNPKVIQASMGSFCRVHVYYFDLEIFLKSYSLPIIGTFLDGEDVHSFDFPEKGFILFGNESKGLSDPIRKKTNFQVSIPKYGKAESLNVAVSSAIIFDNMKRRS